MRIHNSQEVGGVTLGASKREQPVTWVWTYMIVHDHAPNVQHVQPSDLRRRRQNETRTCSPAHWEGPHGCHPSCGKLKEKHFRKRFYMLLIRF